MPITVTATQGILDARAEREILPKLANALLVRNGLAGNTFMTKNVVGSMNILPEGRIYAGGASRAVFVEIKVPSIAFTSQDQRQGFVDDVNSILDELTDGKYPRDQTYVNITHAVDGSWGIGERAFTNADLGEALAASGVAELRA